MRRTDVSIIAVSYKNVIKTDIREVEDGVHPVKEDASRVAVKYVLRESL